MNTPAKLPAFKAYDIRGRLPHELNPGIAYHLGRGLAHVSRATTAVMGMDSRLTSPELLQAAAAGLAEMGVKVSSIGLCGTEEIYHAAGAHGYGLGIMVTASHNPADYNGMKIVRAGAQPFSHDVDMQALHTFVKNALETDPTPTFTPLEPAAVSHRESYVNHLLNLVDTSAIPPLHIVANPGNGAAGPTAEAIFARLPQLKITWLQKEPDGTFPHGIPNPLLPENRTSTAEAVQSHKASLAIAWDGDFDRCFLYDETGSFVSNYYLCGLIARTMLTRQPGASIVYDPRLYWDTVSTIRTYGGNPVVARVGHGYIKPVMRAQQAIFAGEISGHFYFRDFFYCDTGMLTWLLILELMGKTGKTLSQLIAEHEENAPASDEINFRITKPAAEILDHIKSTHPEAQIENIDGLGLIFPEWRANIRTSSNEPLMRLNVEAKSASTLAEKIAELTSLIESHGSTLSNH